MEELLALSKKRDALRLRASMIHSIRNFFIKRGYLEVETPCIISELIPEAHIDAVKCGDLFLHPSPEVSMKRLLAAGFGNIFQICKCFRYGERGTHHLPEFTILEWYHLGIDYIELMEESRQMIINVAEELGFPNLISYKNNDIYLDSRWERLSVKEAFERYAPVCIEQAIINHCFDEMMVVYIEPNLGIKEPTFLYDYPANASGLAKLKTGNTLLAERFELYIAGIEIANGFSELIDLNEHRKRFNEAQTFRAANGKAVCPISEQFLQAIVHMPESAGIALGIDRLAMIFADAASIDDVVAFPPEHC